MNQKTAEKKRENMKIAAFLKKAQEIQNYPKRSDLKMLFMENTSKIQGAERRLRVFHGLNNVFLSSELRSVLTLSPSQLGSLTPENFETAEGQVAFRLRLLHVFDHLCDPPPVAQADFESEVSARLCAQILEETIRCEVNSESLESPSESMKSPFQTFSGHDDSDYAPHSFCCAFDINVNHQNQLFSYYSHTKSTPQQRERVSFILFRGILQGQSLFEWEKMIFETLLLRISSVLVRF